MKWDGKLIYHPEHGRLVEIVTDHHRPVYQGDAVTVSFPDDREPMTTLIVEVHYSRLLDDGSTRYRVSAWLDGT